jgi:hypothetical protein
MLFQYKFTGFFPVNLLVWKKLNFKIFKLC